MLNFSRGGKEVRRRRRIRVPSRVNVRCRSLNLDVFLHVISRKKESVIDGPCAFYRPQSGYRPIFFLPPYTPLRSTDPRSRLELGRRFSVGRNECKTDFDSMLSAISA